MAHVLVVDDEVRILRFTRVALQHSGYQVTTATSGQQALDLFRQLSPDVVLLDIFMPGIDGFEVIKRLREDSQVPIIVTSARFGVEEMAFAAGASDYIAKPYKTDDLIKKVEGVLPAANP